MEMGGSSKALDVAALRDELKYMLASNANISNFVSVKLSDESNYPIWKAQMMCLIQSQELLHIINDEGDDGDNLFKKHDNLVKGWIFGSMNEKVLLHCFVELKSAHELWIRLEYLFSPIIRDIEEDLKYIYLSEVNASNFVSEKLSGINNYFTWKIEMLQLIKSYDLLHIIHAEVRTEWDCDPMTKKYDKLVKGWILSAMSDNVLTDFNDENSVQRLWRDLEQALNPDPAGFLFRTEFIRDVPEIESVDIISLKKDLYEASLEGCWWKAKSILKTHKNTAIEAIAANGNTILHVAVEMGHDYFVEKLLEFLKNGEDIDKKNNMGQTALHIAAMVGNEHATQLLLQKRKELLMIRDCEEDLPWLSAAVNLKLNISTELLKSIQPSDSETADDFVLVGAVCIAIVTKKYDLAKALLNHFPDYLENNGDVLMAIVITFPSDHSFMESFIYPSYYNVCQRTVVRGSLLFHSSFLDKCADDILRLKVFNKTCFNWLGNNYMILVVPVTALYQIYQLICLLMLVFCLPFSMLYFLVWKVLAVTFHPIKNIVKKKKEYEEAKNILRLICTQMGPSNYRYRNPLFQAVRQGVYEVVDEILFTSPNIINSMDEQGYNIIQLAIINRSEKVYNLVYHIIERTESYKEMVDSSGNNLVHLVGKLAPSFVLDRTTGAALQLQRELLWREEVEKLFLPIEILNKNINDETPDMVFTREHQCLIKEGENWAKTTAESCSITAALIVTIVFAAAITVPGGSNQESGIPVFKKEIAFTIFAISNAFSLFTATTSLLLFLSILTARFSEKDFLGSIPRRLILGLLTLFLATTAMIVAFGAILFLVFCDQRPWMLALICGFSSLPILVIVTIKLPLLADLIQSTYFPIFGKQRYLESCKISRKNTIFME